MTTQDLINTLRQGKPMTAALMREIVRELEEKNEQLRTMGTALRAKDADYAVLLARHNALVEAVAWELECEWMNSLITEQYACVSEIAPEEEEISVSYFAARAEVDLLIADCKGER